MIPSKNNAFNTPGLCMISGNIKPPIKHGNGNQYTTKPRKYVEVRERVEAAKSATDRTAEVLAFAKIHTHNFPPLDLYEAQKAADKTRSIRSGSC